MKTMINYAEGIHQAIVNTQVMSGSASMYVNEGIDKLVEMLHGNDHIFFIGNGGSGAACDHMANDLCLAGKRAQSLTNTNNITCIANDFGFAEVFKKQLEWLSNPSSENTLLLAFSCSGMSQNIIDACMAAKYTMSINVVTFTGKQPDNTLRKLGHLNFYVPSNSYGVVQIAHEALIHCAIDKLAGIY
jgi:D-sedoheptulose 7-phosphate isomerase